MAVHNEAHVKPQTSALNNTHPILLPVAKVPVEMNYILECAACGDINKRSSTRSFADQYRLCAFCDRTNPSRGK